ncbi:MAG: dihydrolipoyl dehydrogenase [Desulfovibrionaceae bacterium]|nr:dihydrolipoyl dehydrogenase [Desulfovibrionaceae bacterium]
MKIAIIGGGPGGYVAAIRAAQLGAETTLVEHDKLGGVCLNSGCIPTKALLRSASLYTEAREGAHCGVMAEARLDFARAQEYKAGVVKRLVSGVAGLLSANKVRIISASASLAGGGRIRLRDAEGWRELDFDRIILATGSLPVLPPIPGADLPPCLDSAGALNLDAVPESLLILGGGIIGMEMATLYNALGSQVIVVEMLEDILPMLDGDIAKSVRADLGKKGVRIFTASRVTGIREQEGKAVARVESSQGAWEFSVDKALICVGRKPNIASLNLDGAGIRQERGGIHVNSRLETSLPEVYAIGDCNGLSMLAHAASVQGEIAAENALGESVDFNPASIPSCLYTSPECAGAGLTEEEAKIRGLDYVTGKFPLLANGKALIMNRGKGFIKIIAGRERKEILGAHIVGPRATDLIAEAALAIEMKATVQDVVRTVHAHPTVAEAFREAALVVDQRAIHILNK